MMMCHVCGTDVERTINVNFENNPIPEKWCLACLRKPEYGTEENNASDSGWYPEPDESY